MTFRPPLVAPRWAPDPRVAVTSQDGVTANRLLNLYATPAPVPFNQYDWPLPTAAPFPPQLRSWAWSYNLRLIGQDQLPNRQQDWPVPIAPPYHVQLRTWVWSYNLNLIGQDALPFRQQDWPLPTQPAYFAQWRSWAWSYNLRLIGKDALPFRQQDWPLPTPNPDKIIRSWIWNYNPNLIGKDKLPVRQQDWPLPISRSYPVPAILAPNLVLNAVQPVVTVELHDSPFVFGTFAKLMGH